MLCVYLSIQNVINLHAHGKGSRSFDEKGNGEHLNKYTSTSLICR